MNRVGLLRTAGFALAVALAYYVSGRLGLLLAIPPGYATAVWPASGIALAGVIYFGFGVWPGIWLGSFLINVWTALDTDSLSGLLRSLLLPCVIGAGAAAQAVAGAAVIQRWVGYRNLLTQEIQAVYILLLGGPVACVISASVGVVTLWMRGLVPTESLGVNWLTWWIGDSIGVMIFAPLLLVWTVRPYKQWFGRQIYATVPLVLGFTLVVALFVIVSHREQLRLRADFQGVVSEFQLQMQRDLKETLDVLYSVQSFYDSSTVVESNEFDRFALRLLTRAPGIRALSWNPREVRGGREVVAVRFIVPVAGNKQALGYNVASERQRAEALRRAAESAAPAATAPLQLVQDSGRADGILIFTPVFRAGTPPPGRAERLQNVRGYVAAVSRVEDLLAAALKRVERNGIQVRVQDRSTAAPLPLWASSDAKHTSGDLFASVPLDVAGRIWQADLWVPAAYLVANRSWQTWMLLATGMLFTGLLGMFLLLVIGRGAVVEQQVTERTAELKQVNELLRKETLRSEQLEAETRRQNLALAASNHDLDQFAYVASHDLQAPLRNLSGYTGLIEHRLRDKLDAEDRQYLDAIHTSCIDMRGMIEGLLRMSRLTHERLRLAPVALSASLERALAALKEDLRTSRAEVQHAELPTVRADGQLLAQLLQNLIGNAIKFQPPGQSPRIAISAERQAQGWQIGVRDNGIGIPAGRLNDLFGLFKRLHSGEDYAGYGIGLALCKKIVQLHQGQIWVESTPGQGTTFYFTLPAAA